MGGVILTLALGFAAWKVASRRPVVVAVFPPASDAWVGNNEGQTRLSPDGRKIWLAASWQNGKARGGAAIWNLEARRKICDTPNFLFAAWSHDSQTLALMSDVWTAPAPTKHRVVEVTLINAQNGKLKMLRDNASRAANLNDWGHALAFSRNDREVRLLSLTQLRRFDLQNGRVSVLNLGRQYKNGSEHGQFLPDGDLLLTDSQRASQWQITPDGKIERRAFNLPKCNGFRFSRDGKWAVGWFFDGSVGVFQTYNWRQMWRIPKEKSFVEFSSDSREVYVLEYDQPMARFDVQTGRKIGESAPIFNAIASPDGRYFLEARDGKIWRWPNPAF